VNRIYIDGVVQKILDIIPTGVVTGDLDESTAGPSRFGATVREAGVCLLGIGKPEYVFSVSASRSMSSRYRQESHTTASAIGEKRIPSQQYRKVPCTLPTRSNPKRHPRSHARRATYAHAQHTV
jgi:hypothetical protein